MSHLLLFKSKVYVHYLVNTDRKQIRGLGFALLYESRQNEAARQFTLPQGSRADQK